VEEELLSKEQVVDVIKFAQALYGMNGMNGVFNPDILNKNLSGINVNVKQPTVDELSKALNDPINNQDNLMGFNEWTQFNDMIFKKTIEYYSNLLSFDLSMYCSNAVKGDYKSKEYKEDIDRVYKFLDKFDYRAEFAKMVAQMVRKETVFVFFRQDSTNKYILQQIPQKYCRITGACEWTMMFDFDMSYFTNPATSVEQFPKCFEDYYIDVFGGNGAINQYTPLNTLGHRDGTYALWHQTDLKDGAWVFKFDSGTYANIPFLSPMIYDTLMSPIIRNMQKNKNIASAYSYLVGEIPFLQETKATKVDQFAVDLNTLGAFMRLLKDGLAETVKMAMLPSKEIDMFQYEDKNKEMYSNQLKSTSGLGNSASRMIYSEDRMGQFELQSAILTDGNMMSKIYSQFVNFLEYFINQKTRKYKFKFKLEGLNHDFHRKQRIDNVMKLAEMGVYLESAIASAYGFAPQEWKHMIEESKASGFKFESIHTKSDDNSSVGRKTNESKNEALTESGEKTVNSK